MADDSKTILLINGPELGKLGEREPAMYGSDTLADIEHSVKEAAKKAGYDVICLQSDSEDEITRFIREKGPGSTGIIINPAVLTHHSIEVSEALAGVECRKIEVHLTNLYAREQFRHESITGGSCDGVIMGFGMDGYLLAIEQMLYRLEKATVE